MKLNFQIYKCRVVLIYSIFLERMTNILFYSSVDEEPSCMHVCIQHDTVTYPF